MRYEGVITKMKTELLDQVEYYLDFENDFFAIDICCTNPQCDFLSTEKV